MVPRSSEKKSFFISYTNKDRTWATWIAWVLEDAGYTTMIQEWDFPPGSDFVQEMDRALKSCGRVISVLTPNYLMSDFAAAEWHAAFRGDPIGMNRSLLPVRVGECDPEALLGTRVYVDLVGLTEISARQRLLDAAGTKRRKPKERPPHPSSPLPKFAERTEPTLPAWATNEILRHLEAMVERREDADFLVHTLYGLASTPNATPEPPGFETVYYLWADARGGRISATLEDETIEGNREPHLAIRFANAPRTNPANIALRPAKTRALANAADRPRRHRAGRRYLVFEARGVQAASSNGEDHPPAGMPLLDSIALGYRVIDRYGTHWRINDSRRMEVLSSKEWTTLAVDLAGESWSVFNHDGNYRYARIEPDFSMIVALVIEFGGDEGDQASPGKGAGEIHIRRLRLEESIRTP